MDEKAVAQLGYHATMKEIWSKYRALKQTAPKNHKFVYEVGGRQMDFWEVVEFTDPTKGGCRKMPASYAGNGFEAIYVVSHTCHNVEYVRVVEV